MIARFRDAFRAYAAGVERFIDGLTNLVAALLRRIPDFTIPDRAMLIAVTVGALGLFLFGIWGIATTLREANDSGVGLFGPAPFPQGPRRAHVWTILLERALALAIGAIGFLWVLREWRASSDEQLQH